MGTCVECLSDPTCAAGSIATACDSDNTRSYCQPCFYRASTRTPLLPYQVSLARADA